jgi:ornithine cyclodeaminase
MLLFKQETGELASILLDEGHLTDVRTAIAGAISAKYLAPKNVRKIGIVGTGIQAYLQLKYLKEATDCQKVLVWGRSIEKLNAYKTRMGLENFEIETTLNSGDILKNCNLIVTTTPAKEPILFTENLQKGTHITAVGSDTPHKQELDSEILQKADLIVADSISQCLERGEIYKAISENKISVNNLTELGDVISGKQTRRTSEEQITVADLTGVAVQDMQIAKAVYLKHTNS